MEADRQLKLMAAAIYEIRLLLSKYLGSKNESDDSVRLAAHLSYALHNDALSIIEGGGGFDVDAAKKRIRQAEVVVGHKYADNLGILGSNENA